MVSIDKDQKMKHFRKWAEGKNPFLTAMSLIIAGFSKECFELFNSVRKGKRIEGDIPLPSVKTWIKLYNNPKRIGKALFSSMNEYNQDSAKEFKILQLINKDAKQMKNNGEKYKAEFEKIPLDERKKRFEESVKLLEELKELNINDHISKVNEAERKKFRENFRKPEFIFFIRVQAPCFSLYGTYPHILLKQAQNGDDEALEKLIRLDKSIIFEPKISEIIHQAQALKVQERMSMIKKAFISKPKVKMNMKTIKCHLGGLISYLSIALNQKITASEIKDLFDAIAIDMNEGEIDKDIGKMESYPFEKAIQRSRNFWHIILADKK
ncbi:MAG TPA: hypothetical protein VMU29_11575 [Smithella sp.]|nr:hypothetical protein [Smithella sp.]